MPVRMALFCCGVLLFNFFSHMPSIGIVVVCALVGVGLSVCFRHPVILAIGAFLVGLAWASFYAYVQLQKMPPKQYLEKTIVLDGRVVSIPEKRMHSQRFVLQVKKNNHFPHDFKVEVSWYGRFMHVQAGDYCHLDLHMRAVRSLSDPGGHPQTAGLLERGIRTHAYVRKSPDNKCHPNPSFHSTILRLRQAMANRMASLLHHNPLLGVIQALTIGVRDRITPEQWQVFRASGTTHLVAISGLHIGLIAGMFYQLIYVVWRYLPRLCLIIAAQRVAAIAAVLGGFAYAALAGFALSTERALLMLSLAMLAVFFRRRVYTWRLWGCALTLLLILDPLVGWSLGFYLSFAAVAWIFYSMRLRASKGWRSVLRMQAMVSLGLIPWTLFFFQQYAPVSLLANIIAIPWVGFVVVPLALMASAMLWLCPIASDYILHAAVYAMQGLYWILQHLTLIPLPHIAITVENMWVLLLSELGFLLLLAPRAWPMRRLGVIYLLVLGFWPHTYLSKGVIDMWVLDVGQGLASVIQTRHHTLIFDTGPHFRDGFDAGASVMLPFLKTQGIQHIDTMIISHGDNDHSGGAAAILAHLPVDSLYGGEPKRRKLSMPMQACHRGIHWRWDGVLFSFLNARPHAYDPANAHSCVLLVDNGYERLLLPGDIEYQTEQNLVKDWAEQLHADILIAPHHGSKTSSSVAFIEAVKPNYVIFATGYHNRFHFPSPKVVKRYKDAGVIALNTADCGAVHMVLATRKKQPIDATCFRLSHQHYWDHNID